MTSHFFLLFHKLVCVKNINNVICHLWFLYCCYNVLVFVFWSINRYRMFKAILSHKKSLVFNFLARFHPSISTNPLFNHWFYFDSHVFLLTYQLPPTFSHLSILSCCFPFTSRYPTLTKWPSTYSIWLSCLICKLIILCGQRIKW